MSRIDWESVHRRLAQAEQALAEAGRPSAQKAQEILQKRARLAARQSRPAPSSDALEIVAFELGQERYGVESKMVREVRPLVELTPLPGTPPFVLGIMNLRGTVLSVIDLGKLFEMPPTGIGELDRAVVIGNSVMEFGLLASGITGVLSVPRDELQPPLSTMTRRYGSYLLGITRDRRAVLDAQRLLESEEIVVRAGA